MDSKSSLTRCTLPSFYEPLLILNFVREGTGRNERFPVTKASRHNQKEGVTLTESNHGPLVVEGYPGNNILEAEVDDGKSSFAANSVISDLAA
ncbi:hypothetical protein VNO78_07310 [Psophocarpus tetragonolobus]|uniref:Uncharacterized protein n=1 Tax=Psophocarpus tetragonolobus TaxID=3891 RepID=A0AAN9ST32_PSOTE